ncbi:MAG: lipid-A-disaccharide synthase [Boseongicola sp.]|nr:MAG: lipid-A-disaccharide synthase [Boseongicola sp.]
MKAYLLAGEASGDKLGAALIDGMNSLAKGIEFRGVAGPLMQNAGVDSLFPMQELSVMGIAEVLPKYPQLRRRLAQTADDVIAWQPDVLITIDSPDFSLRLAKIVKNRTRIPCVHYVAPSVWAWRPGRAKKMAAHIDHVLSLLPFEPPYMEAAGMTSDFVGHPVVTEPIATEEEIDGFRSREGLGSAPIALVLPGSRSSEVTRLMPKFGAAIEFLSKSVPGLQVVIPAVGHVATTIGDSVNSWAIKPVIIDMANDPDAMSRKKGAFGAANVALAASGTVSLELAASKTPMVIAYDMSWLTWQVMSRLALIDTVTLVNLVSDTREVPEFLGPNCDPRAISEAMFSLLSDPKKRSAQNSAMETTMSRIGLNGDAPGVRAARSVLEFLERHQSQGSKTGT